MGVLGLRTEGMILHQPAIGRRRQWCHAATLGNALQRGPLSSICSRRHHPWHANLCHQPLCLPASLLQANPLVFHRPGMELSPHLAPHLPALFKEIRRRGLELHARPYATLALSDMGAALGLIPADLEAELEALIVGGRLSARIDGAAGVLRAHRPDARAGALGAVLAAGEEFVAASRLLALRASVLQHGLVQVLLVAVYVEEWGEGMGTKGGHGLVLRAGSWTLGMYAWRCTWAASTLGFNEVRAALLPWHSCGPGAGTEG